MDMAHIQALGAIKNATGFTKLGYLLVDSSTIRQNTIPQFESELPKLGFQIVYRGLYPMTVTDFTSYFSQAETAKAQILFVIGLGINKCAAIVNEWYNQESPMVLCGDMPGVADPDFWNTTHGNTECVLTKSTGLALSIPITNETIPAANAFLARWGVPMRDYGAAAYDIVKFFLADAITKAGTTDTNAVINALETTNVDTVLSRGFRFTSNHDIYVDVAGMTSASQSSILYIVAQWQNGVQVPVFPEALRIEAGATYKFPSWKGPWS
jgi:ABC-type branched-subunit amino acid transport system substrate-binding protein